MKRRILTALLAVCLVFALGTIGAYADGENEIEVSSVSELQTAFNNINNNGTIVITEDITATSVITINTDKTVTIDLGGNTISRNGTVFVFTGSGSITIDNGTVNNTGVGVKSAIEAHDGTLTIGAGATVKGPYAVTSSADATTSDVVIHIYGTLAPTDNSNYKYGTACLTVNGQKKNTTTYPTFYIHSGARLTSRVGSSGNVSDDDGPAVYAAGYAHWVFEQGCYVEGTSALSVKSGKIDINGGTFVANGEYHDPATPNYNGTEATGAAISITANDSYAKNIEINISGGTFTSENGHAIYESESSSSSTALNSNGIVITGGEFNASSTNEEAEAIYIKDGSATVNGNAELNGNVTNHGSGSIIINGATVNGTVANSSTGSVSIINSTVDETDGNVSIANSTVGGELTNDDSSVAVIGNNIYSSLESAIAAAEPNDTITLVDDISVDISSIGLNQGKYDIQDENVTIDGNNKTITVTGGDKEELVFNVGADGVIIKNLTINGGGFSKHGINVYQADDVELINVTSKNNVGYGVVVNASSVEADNLTTSGNGSGGVNVDPKDKTTASFTLSGANTSISETNGIKIDNANASNTATVEVSNGYVSSIVEDSDNKGTTTVNVTGGTFGMSIATVADTHPNYEVKSGSYYNYYNTLNEALLAAGAGDAVKYVGATSTTTTYTVTFKLYGTSSYTLTVPAGTEITLPRESYSGYYLGGWKCGGVTYGVGDKVKVNGTMTFDAIWKNGQYDIVIDATMKHGDIYTSVSSADAGEYVYITVDPDLGYKLKSLTVYVSLNNKVTVYKTSALSQYDYYFIMPGATVFVTATFEADGMPFVDVRPYQWHYDAVYYVWSNGLMQGLSDYIFEPDGDMTRAMFWAVLGRIDGEDITGIDWVSEARSWAMTNGVSDGTDPNGKITREQMVTMLWRFLDKPTGTAYMSIYSDANTISSWAKDAMVWAIDEGIIEGITSTTIVPRGTATRAQCATIFMRAEID